MTTIVPRYTRDAIKRYEQKIKRKQIVFNLEKPLELELYEMLEIDDEPASTLIKRLLTEHYDLNTSEQ